MFCPDCGYEIRKEIQFCPNCGQKILVGRKQTPKWSSDKIRVDKPRRKRVILKWYIAIVALLIFVGAGIAGFFFLSDKKRNIAYANKLEGIREYTKKRLYDDMSELLKEAIASRADMTLNPEEVRNLYQPIIAQYEMLIQEDFYRNGVDFSRSGYLNSELIANSQSGMEHIYYSLEDFDGNGIAELLIGASDGVSEPKYFDVFAIDVDHPVRLFQEYIFGYRTNFIILSDGIFQIEESSSAVNYALHFYHISSNGYEEELIESIYTYWDIDDMSAPPKYYQDSESNFEITQAEYEQLRENYNSKGQYTISWTELSGIPQNNVNPDSSNLNIEEQVFEISAEQISQMIVAHYDAAIEEGSGASYMIVDSETSENDEQYIFLLRYCIDPKEAEEIIAQEGIPSANRLVGTVTVNKSDGTAVLDSAGYVDTWNIWTN